VSKIFFNEPYIAGEELSNLIDLFDRNQFYGNGFYTRSCQELIGSILGEGSVLLTDSCTSALEMTALLLRDWNAKQEVIVPSYTFSSTASAYARAGFEIVFAEVDPKTMMIDIADAERKITSNTVAIIGVHYGGSAFEVHEARKVCDKYQILLIEDAAQAFGCLLNDKSLGLFGDFSCFSFHETKNLHCGLGGALVINDPSYLDRAMHIWERGTNRQEVLKGLADKYSWVEIGGSFYPSELQAAFLLAQLQCFDSNIKERSAVYAGYYNAFVELNIDGIYFPVDKKGYVTNFHAFWVIFSSSLECDYVREHLAGEEIAAYIGYVPLHSSKVGLSMGNLAEDLPLTEEYSKRILRLPLHNKMLSSESEMIAYRIQGLVNEYRK
jgi:dTDP-4-amino-4,6-dideoxygalactose transaminase